MPDTVDNSLENFGRPNSFVDHGRGFGEAASAPFKYQKGSLTEGGLRAAAFVYYPDEVAAGRVSDAFITMMDVLPTFLDIAGTEHPGAGPYRDGRVINAIVGRSAWPHFRGEADAVHGPMDPAGWSNRSSGALIRGTYKVINQPPPGVRGTTPWQLYDLSIDPGERHDLAAEHPELLEELVAEWGARWR
jgi:arylsulfatase